MNHRILSLIFSLSVFILSVFSANAQLTMSAATEPLTKVTSNTAVTSTNAYRLQINIPNGVTYHKNWGMYVRVNGNITNSQGRIIPPANVSIQVNSIVGEGNLPSVAQLGGMKILKLSTSEQTIADKVDWEITSGGQSMMRFTITFDIIIAPNIYGSYESDNNYNLNLIFTLKQTNGSIISTATAPPHAIRFYPLTPPPTYSIQINSNAVNGKLEFKSISDYVNGVSQTYPSGLSAISNTPYALQVKAQSSAFESLDNSIPLNTVSLNLKAADNSSIAGTVQLSNATQMIINSLINSGTQARAFDIRYFTNPNDLRLLNAKPDSYKTTLIYTMIPQ